MRAILILVVVFCLLGCEKTVLLDLPPHEPQLVVHSLFTPDSLWRVSVGATIAYEENVDPPRVLNASVLVEEDGAPLETLRGAGGGIYVGSLTSPRPGHVYTLRVAAPGFPTATAVSGLPPPIPRPLAVAQVRASNDPGSPRYLDISLTLRDPGGQANYYGLDVLTRFPALPDLPGYAYPVSFESTDPVLRGISLGEAETFYNTTFFEDDFFDGTTELLDLSLVDYGSGGNPTQASFYVRLFAVTDQAYRYHRSVRDQIDSDGNVFGEPVRVAGNVTGGLGLFAGYYLYEVKVEECSC